MIEVTVSFYMIVLLIVKRVYKANVLSMFVISCTLTTIKKGD